MASEGEQKIGHDEKLTDKNNYEGKFNTLRIISLKAINEFEALQRKCEENYAKYLEERENYARTKKELDILKEVSGEALGEYENLHRKFTIEMDCRDKAEEFAKQAVKENKQLKRQSTFLLTTLTTKAADIDLEELASAAEAATTETNTADDHGLCNEQIASLKEQVESLKIKIDDVSQKLTDTEEQLHDEQEEHKQTKEDLINNNANFKQLNRVSYLALDDYAHLQQKYEMERQNRVQAEKIAVEVSREHEDMMKQSEFIPKDPSETDERLEKALKEISTLTKQLFDQKTEFDEKVKELEEELASSNDVQTLQNLEQKILTFSQGMETLDSRLAQAQTRANEAEMKVKTLEEQLKAKEASNVPAVPPAPPLPPPPPPPPSPGQLLGKFLNVMKKKPKNQKKGAQEEDPRIKAMADMMERIKKGQIALRKITTDTEKPEEDGAAINKLKVVLKTMKKSFSRENVTRKPSDSEDGEKTHTFGVQLRKTETFPRKSRSFSDLDETSPQTKCVTLPLRKPRSHSTGDVLDGDDDEKKDIDQDLLKLLKKRKASIECEREHKPPVKIPEKKTVVEKKEQEEMEDTQVENEINEEKDITEEERKEMNGKTEEKELNETKLNETKEEKEVSETKELNETEEAKESNETEEAKELNRVKEEVKETNERSTEQQES